MLPARPEANFPDGPFFVVFYQYLRKNIDKAIIYD